MNFSCLRNSRFSVSVKECKGDSRRYSSNQTAGSSYENIVKRIIAVLCVNIDVLCAVDRTLQKRSHICGYSYIRDRCAEANCSAAANYDTDYIDAEFVVLVTTRAIILVFDLVHDVFRCIGIVEIQVLVRELLFVVRIDRSGICHYIDIFACCKGCIFCNVCKDVGIQDLNRDARTDSCSGATCDRTRNQEAGLNFNCSDVDIACRVDDRCSDDCAHDVLKILRILRCRLTDDFRSLAGLLISGLRIDRFSIRSLCGILAIAAVISFRIIRTRNLHCRLSVSRHGSRKFLLSGCRGLCSRRFPGHRLEFCVAFNIRRCLDRIHTRRTVFVLLIDCFVSIVIQLGTNHYDRKIC